MTENLRWLLAGLVVGYVVSLFTMMLVWSLCVVAHDGRRELDDYYRSGRDESGEEK